VIFAWWRFEQFLCELLVTDQGVRIVQDVQKLGGAPGDLNLNFLTDLDIREPDGA
jgi:hypothetical protein